MQALNSPLELGVRALIILTASFPRPLDLDRLALMDYCLLHSADLGGPPSLLPPVTTRSGELGVKRAVLEHGVQLMCRAGMVEMLATSDGLTYRASEEADPFLRLITSPLLDPLTFRARWTAAEFNALTSESIRDRMRGVSQQWSDEFSREFLQEGREL